MSVLITPAKPRSDWKSRRVFLANLFPAPLRIALVVMGLAWLVGLVRGPLLIDVGSPNALDTIYLGGDEGAFYQAETRQPNPDFPQADPTYRWAGPQTTLKLPWPLEAEPLRLYVRMTAPRPNQPADQTGTTVEARGKLEWANQELGRVAVNGAYEGNYYRFNLPNHLRPNLASYELSLTADNSFRPGTDDGRLLSLLIFSVRLEPDYPNFGWQGWLASLELPALMALISFCCWGIGHSLWQKNWLALLSAGVAGGLMVLSIVGWPLEAAPLYAPWALILPVSWLLLVLAELFRRRATGLPAPFIYAATLFPLLPLAQFAVGRLYLYNLNPGAVTLGVYVGALFFSGAYYVNSGPGRPQVFERSFVRAMLGASAVGFLYNHFNVFQTNLYRGADFRVYYETLQRFEHGGPLYDLKEIASLPGATARMPPGFTFLLWPFERLFGSDINLAILSWRFVSELLLIPCILILLKIFGDNRQMKPAIWFFALNFGQVAESLGYGQFNIIVLLGLCLMALWVKEGRSGLAGAALALPVSLKLYPIVSALYFPRRNWWRGWLGLLAGGGIVTGLVSLTVGFEQVWFYATQVVLGVNRPEPDISNQSLWGFLDRLAITQVVADYKGDIPGWVNPLAYGLVVGLVLLTLWVNQRQSADDLESQQLKLGSLALLAVLIPPFVWFHYIVPVLPAVLALALTLQHRDYTKSRWPLIVFALAYGMLAYGGRNDFFFTDAVGLARFSASFRFLAALALWALSLKLLVTGQAVSPQTELKRR